MHTVLKALVFTSAALLCARNFWGVLTSQSHINTLCSQEAVCHCSYNYGPIINFLQRFDTQFKIQGVAELFTPHCRGQDAVCMYYLLHRSLNRCILENAFEVKQVTSKWQWKTRDRDKQWTYNKQSWLCSNP